MKISKLAIFLLIILVLVNFISLPLVEATTEGGSSEGGSNSDDSYSGGPPDTTIINILRFLESILDFVKNIKDGVDGIYHNMVQWIVDALIEFPIALGETLIDMIVNPLAAAVPQFLLESVDIGNIPIVNTIWKASFGIGLVILVILTALGLGFGGNEAFIYDNFGLPEHILIRMFYTLGLMTASKEISIVIYNIATWMTNYMFSETALAISTAWDVSGIEGIIKLVALGLFLLPAVLLNIIIYVILIIRILDLMMLTALSPISASTFVLPNTKSIALNHFKEYIAVVLVQFVIIVFLALWTGLATFMDGLMLKFTGEFALQGLAQVVGQGIMMIVLTVYTLTRPGWLKRMLGVGTSSSISGMLALARMFI